MTADPETFAPAAKEMTKAFSKIHTDSAMVSVMFTFGKYSGMSTGKRPHKGCMLLKDFAKEANVADLDIFTCINMREKKGNFCAVTYMISNLEQDQRADFLGHDIRIQRSIYRLLQEVFQKAKLQNSCQHSTKDAFWTSLYKGCRHQNGRNCSISS